MDELRTVASCVVAGAMLLALAWSSGVPADPADSPLPEIERPRLEPRIEVQLVPSISRPSGAIEPGDNFIEPGDNFIEPGDNFIEPGDNFINPRFTQLGASLCGTLTTDQTLSDTGQPYVLCASGASVTGGATLRIEPGVTMLAEPGATLRIRRDGVLQALGNEASPIRFLGLDPTPGSWTGIWHESDAEHNELAWVEIAHGGTRNYANLYIAQRARIRIQNSTFRDSGTWGVNVAGASVSLPQFQANRFHGNALSPLRIYANQMHSIDGESIFTANGRDVIEVRPAWLTGDTHVWGRTSIPFLLTSSINVSTGLEVKPGFQLLAADGAGSIRIRWDGSIRAIGTAAEPIRFTSESGRPGAWSGLWIESDADNELNFVEVAHGGRGSYDNIYLGSGASVVIENSIIRESAAFGINVGSGTATLAETGNFFRGNTSGDIRAEGEVLTVGGTPPFSPSALMMTEIRFEPVAISTPELAMTGIRFEPVTISTPELTMTGIRFEPVTISTPELTMTGIRFEPVTISTPELMMTGFRE